MRCYKNLLNIEWQQKVTGDSIRQQVNRKERIINIIRRKKLVLFEHVCRLPNHRLVNRVLLCSVDGVWHRGRQPKWWIDNVKEWTALSIGSAMKKTRLRAVEKTCIWPHWSLNMRQEGREAM